MTKKLKPIQSVYLELVHEYFKSNQKCQSCVKNVLIHSI